MTLNRPIRKDKWHNTVLTARTYGIKSSLLLGPFVIHRPFIQAQIVVHSVIIIKIQIALNRPYS